MKAIFTLYLLSLLRNTRAANDAKNGSEKRSTRINRTPLNPHSDDHEIDAAKQDETVQNMVKWSIAKGGFIHPHVEIRRLDPSDPTSYFGAFVNGPVGKDELLIKIPGSIKIQMDDIYRTDRFTYDEAVFQTPTPAMWSDLGKYLITKVQGDLSIVGLDQESTTGEHVHGWIDEYFDGDDCLLDTDTGEEMEEWYVAMAIQRGYDFCLIPIYDMLNHNSGIQNIITRESIYGEDGFGVYALKDLNAGDELLYSYQECLDCNICPETCKTSQNYWRTPELLRDFGFVEAYPQRFYYEDIYLKIDEHPDGLHITNEGQERPEIEWIKSQIERLEYMYDLEIHPLRNAMPPHELETIINYHQSLLNLFTTYYEANLPE